VAALAAAIGQRLHRADMEVTPRQSEHYARSLQLAKPSSRRELYHTTRAIFVTAGGDVRPSSPRSSARPPTTSRLGPNPAEPWRTPESRAEWVGRATGALVRFRDRRRSIRCPRRSTT
jgi:hypothetical protein